MRSLRTALVAVALLGCAARVALAQPRAAGLDLRDIAGVWDYRSIIGSTDTTAVASVLRATPDRQGWTLQHASDPVIAVRVAAAAGDSVVLEAGPYGSTLRPGQTVTRMHIVLHYDDRRLRGAFDAHYASGAVVAGRSEATRREDGR